MDARIDPSERMCDMDYLYELTHDMTAEFVELNEHPRHCDCPECNGDPSDYEQERQVCPYCNGTTLDLSGDSGGTCPHCFGGYIPR